MQEIILGDCCEVMAAMPADTFDAVVTDPPYSLGFMGRDWDKLGVERRPETWETVLRIMKPGAHLIAFGGTRTFHRTMCAIEDAGFELRPTISYLFGSGFPKSRNVSADDIFCQCEALPEHDVRDMPAPSVSPTCGVEKEYARSMFEGVPEQGVPKSREARPEPKPTGAAEPRVEGRRDVVQKEGELHGSPIREGAGVGAADGATRRVHHGASSIHGGDVRETDDPNGSRQPRRSQSSEQRARQPRDVADERGSQAGGVWPLCDGCGKQMVPSGLGTALKPGWEAIIVARKPIRSTIARNVAQYGTGAINIDAARIGIAGGTRSGRVAEQSAGVFGDGLNGGGSESINAGRWPADVVFSHSFACVELGARTVRGDGHFPTKRGESGYQGGWHGESETPERNLDSETVTAWECAPDCPVAELDRQSGATLSSGGRSSAVGMQGFRGDDKPTLEGTPGLGDFGGASRFFYCAKASTAEREAWGRLELEPRRRSDGRAKDIQNPRLRTTSRVNDHVSVKPLDLMEWLLRLVVPDGGLVLDPFAGSGSTLVAARRARIDAIGIEREARSARIARARLDAQWDVRLF